MFKFTDVLKVLLLTTVVFFKSAEAGYPEKPVKIIVSFPVGSGTDIIARIISEPLSKALGQPVFVENHPGAEGYVGAIQAKKAAPDGYTLLLAPTGVFVSPLLRKSPAYDPSRDFSAIGRAGTFQSPLLVVPSKSYVGNIEQFLTELRKGTTFYGTGNITGVLATEQLKTVLNIQATQVPYKGEGDALRDLAAGRIDWMFALPTAASVFLQNGTVRPLATSGNRKMSGFETLPSLASTAKELSEWEESGSLVALLGPANMNEELIATLSSALRTALQDTLIQDQFKRLGFTSGYTSSEELDSLIKLHLKTWKKIIEVSKLQKTE